MTKLTTTLLASFVGIVIGVPVLVTGASVGSYLIEGQSVPEALQTVANNIEMLMGRVNKIEQDQASFATSTTAIEEGLSSLKTSNEELKAKNEHLESKLNEIEQRPPQTTVVERTVIERQPIVMPITPPEIKPDIKEELHVSLKNRPQHDILGDGRKNIQMLSVHLHSTGDQPINVLGFYVGLTGNAPRSMINEINLLAGNDAELATDRNATQGVLEYHFTLQANEERDLILAIDMDDDIRSYSPSQIGLRLDNIIVDGDVNVVGQFPIEGLLYTASSTRR